MEVMDDKNANTYYKNKYWASDEKERTTKRGEFKPIKLPKYTISQKGE